MAMFKNRELLERLAAMEARLAAIESKLAELESSEALRAELRRKDEEIDALARQGMHVVDLLDTARREIAQLKGGA